MLESAKKVLAARIEKMPEEALLALLEETFPYVSPLPTLDNKYSTIVMITIDNR